jgi:anthranilate synthase component 1
MQVSPRLEEFVELSRAGNLVPVYTDLMADFETPVSVYSKLRQQGPAYLLESIEGGANLNRYSFIGCQPETVIEARLGGATTIERQDGTRETFATPEDPLTVIEAEMAKYRPVRLPDMPRFVGGAVGYLGYEFIHAVEPSVEIAAEDVLGMPVIHFMVTPTLVIFDRARQTIRLLANAHLPEGADPTAVYAEAKAQLKALATLLETGRAIATVPVPAVAPMAVPPGNFKPAEFEQMVEACKEYVRAGDIIQVVGSQRFECDFEKSPLALYRALRW